MSKIKWSLKKINVSDLKEWDKNPRVLTKKGIADLKASITKFGMAEPININTDMTICGGHGRKKVLEMLGIKDVDCYIPEEKLTEKEFKELNIRLNKNIAGDWDYDALGNWYDVDDLNEWGFTDNELVGIEEIPEETEGDDDVPDVQDAPVTIKGDIYELGDHRVMCGDSTMIDDVEKLMDGVKADMVFTSPPYNQSLDKFKPSGMQKENPNWVKKMASSYSDSKDEDDYQKEQIDLLNLIFTFTTDKSSFFYNHKIRYRNKKIISPLEWLLKVNWNIRQEIIWDRSSSITLNARMFYPIDERIYWMSKDDFYFNDKTKEFTTIWDIPPVNEIKNVSAPCPNELQNRCILACSNINHIVLDPYCGTGTTLIACEKNNRKCYGMEIDERYCDVIVRRYIDFCNKNNKPCSVKRNGKLCKDFEDE